MSSHFSVLGPRILINCQLTNDVVPNIASPIYTLAMKNDIVCLSGIMEAKRAEIHKLVGFMGGLWSKDLVESTTHLITNTTTSPKYEVCEHVFTLFITCPFPHLSSYFSSFIIVIVRALSSNQKYWRLRCTTVYSNYSFIYNCLRPIDE